MPSEDLSFLQSTFLAFIQGLTEFLPISSSAHLLLPRVLLDWPEQGLAFDVILHLGSLLAVILYFREDLKQLIAAWIWSLGQIMRGHTSWFGSSESGSGENHATLAWLLIIATLPAGLVGLLWQTEIETFGREGTILAVSSIVFGLILLVADRFGGKSLELSVLNWRSALLIGLSQVLALIPGTSRSGVTMSAALFLGFSRVAATRFSFLMAIPIIAASSALELGVLWSQESSPELWLQLMLSLAVSAIVAFACIHFFLQAITKIGFLPFVAYRLALGVCILAISAY